MTLLFEGPGVVVRYIAPAEIAWQCALRHLRQLAEGAAADRSRLRAVVLSEARHPGRPRGDGGEQLVPVGGDGGGARGVSARDVVARKTVTYGSSMGGYGALLFSGLLEPDAAVAISPQFSVRRGVVEDRRWAGLASQLPLRLRRYGARDKRRRGQESAFYDPGNAARSMRIVSANSASGATPSLSPGIPRADSCTGWVYSPASQQELAEDPGRDLAPYPPPLRRSVGNPRHQWGIGGA